MEAMVQDINLLGTEQQSALLRKIHIFRFSFPCGTAHGLWKVLKQYSLRIVKVSLDFIALVSEYACLMTSIKSIYWCYL